MFGSQSSFRMRRSSSTDTPSWSANLGSLHLVSVRVSYSMNRRSEPSWTLRTDFGGVPLLSWSWRPVRMKSVSRTAGSGPLLGERALSSQA
jgi:hypothetical protein